MIESDHKCETSNDWRCDKCCEWIRFNEENSEKEISNLIIKISSLEGFIKGFTEGLIYRLESIEKELRRK